MDQRRWSGKQLCLFLIKPRSGSIWSPKYDKFIFYYHLQLLDLIKSSFSFQNHIQPKPFPIVPFHKSISPIIANSIKIFINRFSTGQTAICVVWPLVPNKCKKKKNREILCIMEEMIHEMPCLTVCLHGSWPVCSEHHHCVGNSTWAIRPTDISDSALTTFFLYCCCLI